MAAGLCAQQSEQGPDQALAFLKAGNLRYQSGKTTQTPVGEGVRRSLAKGQRPQAIVVTCADSRVPVEHIFNCGLGEVFVIRTAGGVCDPETLASIEFAASRLGAPLCVFMAHTHCDAVRAAAEDLRESPSMTRLIDRIHPALRAARQDGRRGRDLLHAAEQENAQRGIHEALRRSPKLRALSAEGRFRMQAAHYHLDSGRVEWLPRRPLEPEAEASPREHAQLRAKNWPPQVAFRLLLQGHRRYLGNLRSQADLSAQRRGELVEAQHPFAIVVTCADSRVPPEILFDAGLGEIAVIRVAGNVANPEVIASVEYAAAHSGASYCLVLGHRGCDAIHTAIEHGHEPGHSPSMRALLDRITPAVEAARHGGHQHLLASAVGHNAQNTVRQLRRESKIIRDLEHRGHLELSAAVYDLETGEIEWLRGDAQARVAARPEPAAAPGYESAPGHGAAAPSGHGHAEPHEPGHHHEPEAAPDHQPEGHGSHADHGLDHSGEHSRSDEHGHGDEHGESRHYAAGAADARAYQQHQDLIVTISAAAIITIAFMMCLLFWQNRPRRGAQSEAEPAE